MGINGPVSEIITIIRSILIGCKGSPQRGVQQCASTKTPAPRISEHKFWRKLKLKIKVYFHFNYMQCWNSVCALVWVFIKSDSCVCLCEHNYVYVCIYRAEELISPDSTSGISSASCSCCSYNALNELHCIYNCCHLQRMSQFINQRCVYTALNKLKISTAVDKHTKRHDVHV